MKQNLIAVDAGALKMVLNALERDAASGMTVRGEMAKALKDSCCEVPTAPSSKDLADLLFGLQDAWPYVHEWCTINSVKDRIGELIRKHGDFADITRRKP